MRRIGWRRWAWPCAWGMLCLLGASNALETKAWAQSQRSDNPAAPGQSYLTGDWGGARSYLERLGVTFTFSYTNDFLANVSGGIKTGASAIGIFQPQVDLDLQKLLGWEGDRIHIHGLITHGPFFSSTYLGNILAVSNLEAGEVARLYALWYEHNAPDDRWSVRAGLMLADSQFLQSDTASASSTMVSAGPLFWPATCRSRDLPIPWPLPGHSLRVKPRDDTMLQAAVFSGDPSGGYRLQSSGSASHRNGLQL